MPQFRKKPVVIDAFVFGPDISTYPDWFVDATKKSVQEYGHIKVKFLHQGLTASIYTLEGVMEALEGDYIIKGLKGEIYPCKPEIFEMSYEAVDEK